jgi:hypothetical protein
MGEAKQRRREPSPSGKSDGLPDFDARLERDGPLITDIIESLLREVRRDPHFAEVGVWRDPANRPPLGLKSHFPDDMMIARMDHSVTIAVRVDPRDEGAMRIDERLLRAALRSTMGESKRRKRSDGIEVEAVIESLHVYGDRNTGQVVGASAWIRTAADEEYLVVTKTDEAGRTLQALYEGASARFVGRLSPPEFPEYQGVIVPCAGVIVSSTITPIERPIVVVAAVETIKRVWSDSGGISVALAYVITKDQDRFTVSSRGGEAMNALLGLNPGDVARFTGRFSPPFETVPNIELSQVALIERSGPVEPWREQWFFVSTDRLSPDFRRRIANCRTESCKCFSCRTTIETADRIALVVLRDCKGGPVCADCAALPRNELVEKLSVVEGMETSPAQFVTHAKMAECAIARLCGLDPKVVVDWSRDGEWDYGLAERLRSLDEQGAAGPGWNALIELK